MEVRQETCFSDVNHLPFGLGSVAPGERHFVARAATAALYKRI